MRSLPPVPQSEALILETDRLDLIPITREHAPEMFEVLNDPRLHEFTEGTQPTDVETLASQFEYWEKRISPDGSELWLNWAVRLRATDQWIGHMQAGVQLEHANMAWVLGSAWQRQGYATEAARAVLDWLVRLGVGEVRASIHPAHIASIEIAERLGLARTAETSGTELIWKRMYTGASSAA